MSPSFCMVFCMYLIQVQSCLHIQVSISIAHLFSSSLIINVSFKTFHWRINLLYYFSIFKSQTQCNIHSNNTLLWYQWFGHMPLEKLKLISLIPSNDISIENCLVCSKPWQHRLPFLEIYTWSKHPFNFLYIDAWGTYKHSTYDGHKYFFYNCWWSYTIYLDPYHVI